MYAEEIFLTKFEMSEIIINVRPMQWECPSDNVADTRPIEVHAWAHDKDSNPYFLRFNTFFDSFKIELPKRINGRLFQWTKYNARQIYNQVRDRVLPPGMKDEILAYESNEDFGFEESLIGYGICGNSSEEAERNIKSGIRERFPILELRFSTIEAAKYVESRVGGYVRFPDPVDRSKAWRFTVENRQFQIAGIWEHEIKPESKLLAYRGIRHCQWISLKAVPVTDSDRKSSVEREYFADYSTVNLIPEDECRNWVIHLKILGWDIECYSDNHNAFPDEDEADHVAYMISIICARDGDDPKDRKRVCVIMGKCNKAKIAPNTQVIEVKSEEGLVNVFGKITMQYDPDIIIGFNTLGFDYKYLNNRLRQRSAPWPVMGRFPDVPMSCHIPRGWQSAAYGTNKIVYTNMPGRIADIDLCRVIRYDHKLAEYNLNYCAKHFLGRGKHPVSAQEMFLAYENMEEAIRRGGKWNGYQDALDGMSIVANYCIEDTELCFDLWEYLMMDISLTEMANTVRVNKKKLSTGGQQERCLSALYEYVFNYRNPNNKCRMFMNFKPAEPIPFVGGSVKEPKLGMAEEVLYIDFQSLYPSIMEAYNLCYSTFAETSDMEKIEKFGLQNLCNIKSVECTEKYDPSLNREDMDEQDNTDIKVKGEHYCDGELKTYTHMYIKPEYYKGIIPSIVHDLCENRKRIRNRQSTLERGSREWNVLEKRQIAVKVSTNSFYGFLGVLRGGKRPHRQTAVTVTAYGRECISSTNQYLIDKYGAEIIYGDTDSSMVRLPKQIKHPSECAHWIKIVCDEITGLFPDAIVMKPECCIKVLCLKKKGYAYLTYNRDGTFKMEDGMPKVQFIGLMPARRDNCTWAKETYIEIVRMFLYNRPYIEVMTYMVERVKLILSGKLDIKQFISTKSVSGNYKLATYPMKLFTDRLTAEGNHAEPGERLSYVVVDKDLSGRDEKKSYLGNKMMLTSTYMKQRAEGIAPSIDYTYYIEKVFQSHANQVMSIAGTKETNFLISLNKTGLKSRRTTRCNWIHMDKPVSQLLTRYQQNSNLEDLEDLVHEIDHWIDNYDSEVDYSQSAQKVISSTIRGRKAK